MDNCTEIQANLNKTKYAHVADNCISELLTWWVGFVENCFLGKVIIQENISV